MDNSLVKRQDAIDDFYKHPNVTWTTLDILEHINALPSAEPEIIYCKDCVCGHCEAWLCGDGSTDVYGYCGRTNFRVLPYDYCSRAERKTDE